MTRSLFPRLCLILIGLTLTACGPTANGVDLTTPSPLAKPSPPPTQAGSPASEAATQILEPPTLTYQPPAPPVGPPIERLSPGQSVTVSFIEMLDSTEGWALGGRDSIYDHVLRTQDGGRTWKDVTPPEPAAPADREPKEADAAFLDGNHAWVVYSYPGGGYGPDEGKIVWRTGDRGESWQPSVPIDPDVDFMPLAMPFVDDQTGWIFAASGYGMSHEYTNVYRTTDGGLTWERILDPGSSEGIIDVCCKSGAAFADAQIGLVTYDQGPNTHVVVDWTTDGGLKWEPGFLPAPEALYDSDEYNDKFNGGVCRTISPDFLSARTVRLAVDCVIRYDPRDVASFLYATSNGGQTWQIIPIPGGPVQWISPEVGWSLGRDIYLTLDSGLSWTKVKSVTWDGQFSFVSQVLGWAVARSEEAIALVQTSDGGRSWTEIQPRIAP